MKTDQLTTGKKKINIISSVFTPYDKERRDNSDEPKILAYSNNDTEMQGESRD